jgi:iron(III) transport system substrate-binding protein
LEAGVARRAAIPVGRFAALSVLAGLAFTGCGLGGVGSGGAASLTLYNAQHEQTTNALIAAFTQQTGIRVRVKDGDEDVLTAQIEQEGSHSPADVFYSENSNWLQQLDDRGLLAPVARTTLAAVPRQDSATNGDWVGVSARVSALVYDPAKTSAAQLPTSVLQLASPQWSGKLELAPAETDFWPIVSSVAHAEGDAAALAWLRGLKANAGSGSSVPDNETLTSDVSRGIADIGLINHYYFYRLRSEVGASSFHAKLAYFAPGDPGYVEDISGAAVLSSSTHQVAAQKFLAFLTGPDGQRIIEQSDSFEYPIRPGVAASPQLPPLRTLKPANFTPAELGTGLDAKRLLQDVGLL